MLGRADGDTAVDAATSELTIAQAQSTLPVGVGALAAAQEGVDTDAGAEGAAVVGCPVVPSEDAVLEAGNGGEESLVGFSSLGSAPAVQE